MEVSMIINEQTPIEQDLVKSLVGKASFTAKLNII